MEPLQWYYTYNNQQMGPVSQHELGQLFRDRRLGPDTLVWNQQMSDWAKATTISGLVPTDPVFGPPPISPPGAHDPFQKSVHVAAGYAGFWKRAAASILDAIILAIGGGLFGALVGGVLGGVMGASGSDIETIQMAATLVGNVLGIVLNWLYYTLFESSAKQATPGKMALGIVVTDMDGRRITFARANGRYWAKILSALILMIGFIMAGFTEKKQALHDIISGCLVVNR